MVKSNKSKNRNKPETDVEESDQRYRTIMMSIGDGIIATDTEGCVELMNPVAEELTGWKKEEAKGRQLEEIFHLINEKNRVIVENPVRRVLRDGAIAGLANHSVLISRDGKEYPIYDSGAPIRNANNKIEGVVLVFRDQTMERTALKKLVENEERLRIIFEHTTVGRSLTLPDGKLSVINKAFADMLGRSIDEMHDVNFESITHPDDVAESKECIRLLLANERSTYRMEKRYFHKNGNFIWTDVSTTLLRDSDGLPVNFITSIIDITNRKKAEKALIASEKRFRVAAGSLTDVVYEWDLEDKVDWYDDIDSIMGYPLNGFPRSLSGWAEMLHPDDVKKVLNAIDLHLKGSVPYRIEYRVRNIKDEWRWWSARGTALRDDKGIPYHWIGSITDITDRKKAEELIEENEKRFKELIESLPQLFWTCRVDGPCDYLSRQWIEYTGIPEKDQLGYRWLEQLHPDDRDKTVAEWLEKVKTGETFDIEFRIRRNDGVFHWFKTTAVPMYGTDGVIIKWFGSNTDFHKIKEAEEQLINFNKELEQKVEERTKELEAFSYSVSHDLRAPLRHVSGYVELLNKHYQNEISDKGQHYLNSISDSVRLMGKLIDDLLRFSRTGRIEMVRSDTDMNMIVQAVKDSLFKDNPGRRIEWIIGTLPSVFVDSSMLQLVWLNLLSNAVKFTFTKSNPSIEIGVTEEKIEWIFFVRDNGVGFDMQYAHKLFGVFQRLHSTEEYEGTGIGLANVRRIISRHGGRTWAESEPDKGAIFYFSIPNNKEES